MPACASKQHGLVLGTLRYLRKWIIGKRNVKFKSFILFFKIVLTYCEKTFERGFQKFLAFLVSKWDNVERVERDGEKAQSRDNDSLNLTPFSRKSKGKDVCVNHHLHETHRLTLINTQVVLYQTNSIFCQLTQNITIYFPVTSLSRLDSCIQFIALVTVCTCAWAKPFPKIFPMVKLDSPWVISSTF